ncbi:fumarylacetoacetate hydrolase family protein [Psychrobacter immobilis]|uniref:fumarylacetoacetate hydrolase family protein n=1 Tax=Psychrobacter immobilis TaxID=498 RepID=UPI002234C21E|nr:fumarylacetoacetate hydrolase family protein [Psychrobacter immobilis]
MTIKVENFANTIYGVILNDTKTLTTLEHELNLPPYKTPAKAPVIYIKPFNTLNTTDVVSLPTDAQALEVGASIGLVIGKTASRLTSDDALSVLAGVVTAVDLSIPHDSYYRPAIREKCFDGSLVLGDIHDVPDLAHLTLDTKINGVSVNTRHLSELKRDAVNLLVDVTEFMTLNEGDVLLLGVEYQAPTVKAGDKVQVTANLLDTAVDFTVESSLPSTHTPNIETDYAAINAQRVGRVLIDNTVTQVTQTKNGQVQTSDGLVLTESDIQWLPPIEIGTVFALGLNYADHAKELAFNAPEKPLVFLKGKNTLVGHNAQTRRPKNIEYMHYECELAVVIGKTASNISADEAKDYILGYTVANDYAIRDYLENYYRPNFRVKNRDHCTPIGPWLTRADQIADPMNLKLTTRINGKTTQEGTTADMIFSVYTVVEYLSSIMTLNPGDVILTGTPEGLADVKYGDVIETEIEGLGVLRNTIVDDETYYNAG